MNRRRSINHAVAGALLSVLLASIAPVQAQSDLGTERRFRVRLTAPLSSDSTKGSKVAAQVVAPEAYASDILEGEVVEAKSSGRMDKKSVLMFTFSKLYHADRPIEIDGQIVRAYNSKGQENVDEQGHIVSQEQGLLGDVGDVLKKVRIPFGRGKNQRRAQTAIDAAALLISYTVTAEKISFDTGSEFELDVRQR